MSETTTPPHRPAGEPLAARVEQLLGRMTMEEKLGQLNMPLLADPALMAEFLRIGLGESRPLTTDAERLTRGEFHRDLGPIGGFYGLSGFLRSHTPTPAEQAAHHTELQRVARTQTRLGIPLLQLAEGCHGLMAPGATIFPEGPALGATWDMELLRDVYHAIGREARGTGVHLLSTLVIEPIRDPRLGRNCEAYSECPFQTREVAFAIVAGLQGDDPTAPDRAGALLTCYPGQSEPVSGMERGAIELSERMVRQVYLPAWTAVSGPDGALSLMVTYPAIDGVPAHGSERWMTQVLRGELDFEGLAVSEGSGIMTLEYERVAEGQADGGLRTLRAGTDVNISFEDGFREPLAEAVRDGSLSEDLVDRAVRRVLAIKLRLGLFEEPLEGTCAPEVVRCDEHLALARRAAGEGIVLLKNDDATLPLRAGLRRIALLGPNADDGRNLLGDYVVSEVVQPVPTVLDALRARLGDAVEVVHERGCGVLAADDDDVAAAARAAAGADVAIVVVGERCGWYHDDEGRWYGTVGERSDMRSLDLTGRQEELVRAVHATGTPTVVVLVNGRALSINWTAEHVPAIVEAWLPGEQGAEAIVDVLLGEVDPSGRMPVTVPRHSGELPAYYNHKPSKQYWIDSDGYMDGDGRPLFAFGHGLSYTTFSYEDLVVARSSRPGVVADVSLTVRNTGERAGREVVQLYVEDRISSVATPIRELRGFAKVALDAGAARTVRFALTASDLALLDERMRLVVEPGVFDVMVGASSADVRLRADLVVERELVLPGAVPLRRTPATVASR